MKAVDISLGAMFLGYVLLFEYIDRPGVIRYLAGKPADLGINIETIKALKRTSGETALALMKLAEPISEDILDTKAKEIGAIRAHQYNFNSGW